MRNKDNILIRAGSKYKYEDTSLIKKTHIKSIHKGFYQHSFYNTF